MLASLLRQRWKGSPVFGRAPPKPTPRMGETGGRRLRGFFTKARRSGSAFAAVAFLQGPVVYLHVVCGCIHMRSAGVVELNQGAPCGASARQEGWSSCRTGNPCHG